MTTERCLLIFKPDLVASVHNVASALVRVISHTPDLHLLVLQRLTMTPAQAERLYEAHAGQPYHARNIEFVTSGPSIAMVLEGEGTCRRMRELVGVTDPQVARRFGRLTTPVTSLFANTLRAQFGTELPRNAVHASENSRDAEREIGIFFPVSLQPEYGMFWRNNGER